MKGGQLYEQHARYTWEFAELWNLYFFRYLTYLRGSVWSIWSFIYACFKNTDHLQDDITFSFHDPPLNMFMMGHLLVLCVQVDLCMECETQWEVCIVCVSSVCRLRVVCVACVRLCLCNWIPGCLNLNFFRIFQQQHSRPTVRIRTQAKHQWKTTTSRLSRMVATTAYSTVFPPNSQVCL